MDFASYDVVSKYYSYAVEYYKDTDDEIQWLPICAIPQTIIATRHCLISMESKFRKIMKNTYRFASNFMIRV